ncbi:hypothetical protein KM043_005035 [Ampulex compressa]|nr:hypothetical protein KM043_005035 [Ampulex compressa]
MQLQQRRLPSARERASQERRSREKRSMANDVARPARPVVLILETRSLSPELAIARRGVGLNDLPTERSDPMPVYTHNSRAKAWVIHDASSCGAGASRFPRRTPRRGLSTFSLGFLEGAYVREGCQANSGFQAVLWGRNVRIFAL